MRVLSHWNFSSYNLVVTNSREAWQMEEDIIELLVRIETPLECPWWNLQDERRGSEVEGK